MQPTARARLLPLILFVATVALSIDPAVILPVAADPQERHEMLVRWADPSPELAAFLDGVRTHTSRGDSIVLLLPTRSWDRYREGYYRASYLLAGREVLPILDPYDRTIPANTERARFIAAWRVRHELPGELVWQGSQGTLVRRR